MGTKINRLLRLTWPAARSGRQHRLLVNSLAGITGIGGTLPRFG